jgi:NAD(P)-dependent dehydrogenase (short-subunit alcohol dehydrogenase family)
MRLKDKVAIVVGAGQTPGDTIGNGRATAILFAREGARVVLVDYNYQSALETQALIEAEGGMCFSVKADVTREEDCKAFVQAAIEAYGHVDVMHNNVGIGGGDDEILSLTEKSWDRIMKYNIRANAIMPGLMNTPMAIEGISKSRGVPKEDLVRQRDASVPLGGKMGTAWDVAYAALFLASDEAKFITGVMLPVDGGQSARIG